MKIFWTWITIVLLSAMVVGQTITGGATISGGVTFGVAGAGLTGLPQLPINWANNHECDPPGGTYDVTKTIGIDYTSNFAGINLAMSDWVATTDKWEHVIIPHGTVISTAGAQITLLSKVGATKCLVFDSDTPLTVNQTVCSHRILDNTNGTSPRNLGCTNDVSSMGTIEFSGSGGRNLVACTIGGANCSIGPNHIIFKNLELRFASSYTTQAFLFDSDDGDTTGLLGSSHLWLIQDFIHGDATDSGTGNNAVSSLARFNSCSFCGLAYNYFDECFHANSESHVFSLEWSPGPLKFLKNWVEGCAIAFITGGSATTPFLPYENIFDVEVRGNRFTNPPGWMSNPGGALDLKSRGENKTASRWLEDGNIYEYSPAIGQSGQCRTLTVRNISSGTGDNYANSVNDITLTNGLCRHMIVGIQLDARSGSAGNGGGVAQPIQNVAVSNWLFYDQDPTGSIDGSVAHPYIIETGAQSNSWTATTATRDATGTKVTLVLTDGGTGFHQTSSVPGDLGHVSGCSDATFNTPTRSGPFPNEGPLLLTGTLPTGLTVVYTNSGTPNATTTGCVFSNEQGYPKNFTATHLSIFGNPSKTARVAACNNIDRYAIGFKFKDNIVGLSPSSYDGLICQGDSNTEGTKSETDMFQTSSGELNHNIFVGRTLSNYTDWPGGTTPSTSNWAPAGTICSGPNWDATCIGVVGMMNGATYESNATLISDYDLVGNSGYNIGGVRAASDGLQVGWSRAQFLAAIQSTKYTCSTPCGTGPFSD